MRRTFFYEIVPYAARKRVRHDAVAALGQLREFAAAANIAAEAEEECIQFRLRPIFFKFLDEVSNVRIALFFRPRL